MRVTSPFPMHLVVLLLGVTACASEASESAEPVTPGASEADIADAPGVPHSRVAETVDELGRDFRTADVDGDGRITATEAQRAPVPFLARSYMLDHLERTYVDVQTLDAWTRGAASELESVDRDRDGIVAAREAAETTRTARRLYDLAFPKALERSVTTDEIDAEVKRLESVFREVSGDGILVRSEVIDGKLPVLDRDMLLDQLAALGPIPRPHLSEGAFVAWLRGASAELARSGGPSVGAGEALATSATARSLWRLAASR